jgi:mono/diheme cytochrome c family protein
MSFERAWPLILLLALACADLERGPAAAAPDAGPDVGASDGGGVPFATVRSLLVDGCGRCHSAGAMAGDTKLLLGMDASADYTAVRAFVNVASPASSRLLAKASGQGHGGGAIYRGGSPEYAALLAWIQSGAAP